MMKNRKPAIVIPTYNRLESLYRLLMYVNNAEYEDSDVTLVISIDGGGDFAIKEFADSFEWKHGTKRIIHHERNLGLRDHILLCGDLTMEYGSIVMLEDDLVVSPDFYNYAIQAINEYDGNQKIAGISLYSYRCNENSSCFPFYPLDNGCDVFFMQVPSSWGQVWTSEQWQGFRYYYARHPFIPQDSLLPSNVIAWPESSWKKHFYNYMIESDLYFVYPYMSLSSNWGDVGTHFKQTTSVFRVQLSVLSNKRYLFPHFSKEGVVYDAYFEILPNYLKKQGVFPNYDFGVDLFGTKDLSQHPNRYFLSVKKCTKPILQYGIEMIPEEQNVLFGNLGNEVSFAKKIDFDNKINIETQAKLIFQNYNKTVYNWGYNVGKWEGAVSKSKTLSYRIGRFITSPFRILSSAFQR